MQNFIFKFKLLPHFGLNFTLNCKQNLKLIPFNTDRIVKFKIFERLSKGIDIQLYVANTGQVLGKGYIFTFESKYNRNLLKAFILELTKKGFYIDFDDFYLQYPLQCMAILRMIGYNEFINNDKLLGYESRKFLEKIYLDRQKEKIINQEYIHRGYGREIKIYVKKKIKEINKNEIKNSNKINIIRDKKVLKNKLKEVF